MRAVGHHPQARQRRLRVVGQRGEQVIQIPLLLGSGVGDPAELARGWLARAWLACGWLACGWLACGGQLGLDLVFHRVRQLDAAGPEELDPVI